MKNRKTSPHINDNKRISHEQKSRHKRAARQQIVVFEKKEIKMFWRKKQVYRIKVGSSKTIWKMQEAFQQNKSK